MNAWKYEIISRVEQDILANTRNKFHISTHPYNIILYILYIIIIVIIIIIIIIVVVIIIIIIIIITSLNFEVNATLILPGKCPLTKLEES